MDYEKVSNDILNPVRSAGFSGYDPFDYLNSTFFNKTGLAQNKLSRLAWLQLGKRLPINMRPLFGVAKRRNPKGVSLFILGMLDDFSRTSDERFLHDVTELADWLITQKSDETVWQHPCWGYHFNWQARAFYVPKGKPNIITTCYVARALYELGKVMKRDDFVAVALNAARFIYKHLLTEADGRIFFAYIPGETAFVHNASLWGAAWLALAGTELDDNELQDAALTVARQSVNEQHKNGAWVYGARHHHQFIDGFHTGYNLEALDMIRKALNITEFDESIVRGMSYYRETFFLEDGTAKYYHNKIYPLDMHSFSQGVLTLLKVGGTEDDIILAQKIMSSAVKTMYLPNKHRFIYQKHRWYTNKINYIRWTQAWAYYGLAFYNRFMNEHRKTMATDYCYAKCL